MQNTLTSCLEDYTLGAALKVPKRRDARVVYKA